MASKRNARIVKSFAIYVNSLGTFARSRNQRVGGETKWEYVSRSTKEEESKKIETTKKVVERNNQSVCQTRFEEVPDNLSGSSDNSSEESGNETRTNSIAIEVNALISQGEQEGKGTQRAPLVDLKIP